MKKVIIIGDQTVGKEAYIKAMCVLIDAGDAGYEIAIAGKDCFDELKQRLENASHDLEKALPKLDVPLQLCKAVVNNKDRQPPYQRRRRNGK